MNNLQLSDDSGDGMDNPNENSVRIDGNPIAVLLDQDEYPSNIGEVVAISDQQLCYLERDKAELVGFKLAYLDIGELNSVEYHQEEAWYRKVLAVLFYVAAAVIAVALATGAIPFNSETQALIIVMIALVTFGVRFSTSTHRHYIRFDLPDQTFHWRSPAIDFKSKAGAAHAVRDYARKRGILREVSA